MGEVVFILKLWRDDENDSVLRASTRRVSGADKVNYFHSLESLHLFLQSLEVESGTVVDSNRPD